MTICQKDLMKSMHFRKLSKIDPPIVKDSGNSRSRSRSCSGNLFSPCTSSLYAQWRIYIVKFWMRIPRGGPNSFNFMQFLGKFGKIVCWLPPGSWRPLLREILDPPLMPYSFCCCVEFCDNIYCIVSKLYVLQCGK